MTANDHWRMVSVTKREGTLFLVAIAGLMFVMLADAYAAPDDLNRCAALLNAGKTAEAIKCRREAFDNVAPDLKKEVKRRPSRSVTRLAERPENTLSRLCSTGADILPCRIAKARVSGRITEDQYQRHALAVHCMAWVGALSSGMFEVAANASAGLTVAGGRKCSDLIENRRLKPMYSNVVKSYN